MVEHEPTRRVLALDGGVESAQVEHVLKALDSVSRIRILRFLSDRVASVNDIANALDMPTSTAALHVETLEESGLIRTELEPASRGLRKVCARMFDQVVINLPLAETPRDHSVELTMPVGAFVDCQVTPTCGLVGVRGPIGLLDDPASFYEPRRAEAHLIWFHQGYVEYRFPNRLPAGVRPEALRLSMELCAEASTGGEGPSDITVWINGQALGSWTSPPAGNGRGRLTPEWWMPQHAQHGLLKVWHVDQHGSSIDGLPLSGVNLRDLHLADSPYIAVRIGVAADAKHIGGLSLFGSLFGNYPQDLVLWIGHR
ncbi:MAG: ArsR family transcriptional regulator [Roseiflexaceae bacterium]